MEKLLNENPLISEEICSFFLKEVLNSIKEDDKDISQGVIESIKKQGINKSMLLKYFESNPRLFFNFFDEKEIIIFLTDAQGDFSFTINGEPYDFTSPKRIGAEKEAVKEAICVYKEEI